MKVYLDNNATTPLLPEVKQEIIESLEIFGNASSKHSFGQRSREKVENSRKIIADYLNADPKEIIFTSGASEGNNLVLKGVSSCGTTCSALSCKPHIITTVIEHPSIANTARCIEGLGGDITYLKVGKDGRIDLEELKEKIRENTVLISVMWANNEIGTIQPIKDIIAIAKEKGIKVHTDAVHVFGKMPIDVKELGVDFLTFSGHKFNALKGTGGLYMRCANHICPLIHGGHQEGMLRAGTENSLGIISMGKALEINLQQKDSKRIAALRDDLEDFILKNIPNTYVNGSREHRLYNTTNISFEFIEGESLLLMLDHFGIAVSTGSACSSDSLEASPVLTALGVKEELAHSSVRFSLGPLNTQEEIDFVKEKLKFTVERLRAMSPLYNSSEM